MYTIGLTGGIGSGKSTVANLFAEHGITIVDADIIARNLVIPNTLAFNSIVEHFGKTILNSAGEINRPTLHQKVFQDPAERFWLEKLLHPLVIQEIQNQIKKIHSPYCIAVIPLLLETKCHMPVDRILIVDAPVALQRKRVQQRDNHSDDLVDAILATQLSREHRLAAADDIIVNDQGLAVLKQQVDKLHAAYLKQVSQYGK